jgi:ornithine cyclodeaminase/alanine dehydrogenase-like protein (mu-crystallin family)
MDLLLLRAADVSALLDLDQLVDLLADAFIELSAGRTSVPPRIAAYTPNGQLLTMPGYVPGIGLETKLVSVFPDNTELGLPTHQAVIIVFDEATGSPVALIDGTVITAARTAASSALSVRLLRRRDASVLAILGAGVQGQAHLQAVDRIFGPTEIRIASRNSQHARVAAQKHGRASVVPTFEEAVRGADVICCCTDAGTPILRHDWLRPGAHITSVGASQRGPEIDSHSVEAASLFVESRVALQPYPAGCHELQGIEPRRATELGEVLAGTRPGRSGDDELTLYKSMGHAIGDAVAATLVLRAARDCGAGTLISV